MFVGDTLCAFGGRLARSLSLTSVGIESERETMVATLLSRKEALEAKIAEKTAELKALCLQEADLTGTLPPETPLEPGEPPPTIRKRVGTSFSFPQSLINNLNGDEDALGALELECKVQTNIAEAALNLANDATVSKAVRRKHRLMYRQSQRNLTELETRLTLLRQGRHQPMKSQQIRKKPRPNTIDQAHLMREIKGQKLGNILNNGSWPMKHGLDGYEDELHQFSSLIRQQRSSGTSQSSNSPRLSARDLPIGLPDQFTMTSSLSQPNIQELRHSGDREIKRPERRSSGRRQWDSQSAGGTLLPNQTYPESHQPNLNRAHSLGSVDGQRVPEKEKEWYETSLDSAPSPPLRTSSRLPTSARLQYHNMKEMYTRDVNRSLISPKPHPVLTRAARSTPVEEMVAQMKGMYVGTPDRHSLRHAYDEMRNLENYTPPETSRFFEPPSDQRRVIETQQQYEDRHVGKSPSIDRMRMGDGLSEKSLRFDDQPALAMHYNRGSRDTQNMQYIAHATRLPQDTQNVVSNQMQYEVQMAQRQLHAKNLARMQYEAHIAAQLPTESQKISQYDPQILLRMHQVSQNTAQIATSPRRADSQPRTQYEAPPHRELNAQNRTHLEPQKVRNVGHPRIQNAMQETQYEAQAWELPVRVPYQEPPTQMEQRAKKQEPARIQYNPDDLTVTTEPRVERPRFLNVTPQELHREEKQKLTNSESVYIDIPDEVDSGRRVVDGSKTPTQPYFHTGENPTPWTPSQPGLPEIVPPHAVTQEEIKFDTVVPFESPQNHTVVQAGIWQPYREETKPFEMSDFYKYSTKFRQARQSPAQGTPEPARKSPGQPPARADPVGVVGVYQPLRPMTCQPVDRRPLPELPQNDSSL